MADRTTTDVTTTPKPSPFYDGFTLGIAGFTLSISFSLLGLILSIVAYRKSKTAGYKNGLALAGIIVGSAGTLFWTAYLAFVIVLIATGLAGNIHTAP